MEGAVELASEHSRSPNESRLRLVTEFDAGLPRLLVNSTVYDLDGRRLGEVDLLDIEAGLVVEYDGADHRTPRQHARDVAKEAALERLGQARTRARFAASGRRDPVVPTVS